ncbi:uncharacterized protein LOC141532148 isoform X2 [Cotesia typhae]|uniref:uncharacterized protein LOC141532148 isoform X2 n=1 Tax=Cotesia typhae TaxID=2053667 RepID=UPI003D69A85D
MVENIVQVWDDLGTKDPGEGDKTQLEDLANKTRDELYDHFVGNGTSEGLPKEIAYIRGAGAKGVKAGDDSQKAVAKAVIQSEEYILSSRFGFVKTDDRYRACDPTEHIRGAPHEFKLLSLLDADS